MSFQSSSLTAQGVLQDWANDSIRSLQSQDRVPSSMGTNRPMFDKPINTADDAFDAINGAFAQQRQLQGGFASDTTTTPFSGTYAARRRQWMQAEEGYNLTSFADGPGRSVGISFFMGQPSARSTWTNAFGTNGPDFDAVQSGRQAMTPGQVETLFNTSINTYEGIVAKATQGYDLREHQRLALVSLAYQRPAWAAQAGQALVTQGPEAAASMIAGGFGDPRFQARRSREARLFRGIS